MASVITMEILLQGKQSWYRSRRDPSGQATKVPGQTEEDELVIVPIIMKLTQDVIMACSTKTKPHEAQQRKKLNQKKTITCLLLSQLSCQCLHRFDLN